MLPEAHLTSHCRMFGTRWVKKSLFFPILLFSSISLHSSLRKAFLSRCTWVWMNSGSWWWTGRSGMLQFMGSQTVGYDWATELNWSKEVGDSCLKTNNNNNKKLNSLKGFSKALLKARWGRHVVGCCRLLGVGILCSCSCPHRSGHDIPINFQQDKYYSLFCSFLSLYKWMLQGQSPENGLSYII